MGFKPSMSLHQNFEHVFREIQQPHALELFRFVSHAWLEPVVKFVACLKHQASLRQLPDQTAYWVCAYANNQHQLQNEICNNPRKTSFYRAIQLCAGVLLVLDENATPFTRSFVWKLVSSVFIARIGASATIERLQPCQKHPKIRPSSDIFIPSDWANPTEDLVLLRRVHCSGRAREGDS